MYSTCQRMTADDERELFTLALHAADAEPAWVTLLRFAEKCTEFPLRIFILCLRQELAHIMLIEPAIDVNTHRKLSCGYPFLETWGGSSRPPFFLGNQIILTSL